MTNRNRRIDSLEGGIAERHGPEQCLAQEIWAVRFDSAPLCILGLAEPGT